VEVCYSFGLETAGECEERHAACRQFVRYVATRHRVPQRPVADRYVNMFQYNPPGDEGLQRWGYMPLGQWLGESGDIAQLRVLPSPSLLPPSSLSCLRREAEMNGRHEFSREEGQEAGDKCEACRREAWSKKKATREVVL